MPLSNGYNTLQIVLHWTIAALVVAQLVTGDGMAEVFDRVRQAEAEGARGTIAIVHILFGATILTLMTVRIVVRAMHGVPPATPESPRWDTLLARASHAGMYVLLFAVPLTGATAWISESETVGDLHATLKTLLVLIVVAHVLGALWHQFFLRDNLIRRMVRPDRH